MKQKRIFRVLLSFQLSDVVSDGRVTGHLRASGVLCRGVVNVAVYKVLLECEATAGDTKFH